MDEEYCNSNSNTFLKIDGTSFFIFIYKIMLMLFCKEQKKVEKS